jgi:replicative DNA helicase
MALLRRRSVNTKAEEQILTAMVVSDSFCRDISGLITKDTIETPYLGKAIGWCKDYYEQYKEAPGKHIGDIFDIEKESLDSSESQAIESILLKLSEEHETTSFNEGYIKDIAFELIRTRSLKITLTKASSMLEAGRIDEAETIYRSHRAITLSTDQWTDPFNIETIKNWFIDKQRLKNAIFSLPGALGPFIGPIERHWLLGILAPPKRGKSFWLIELALQAVFSNRKVVFISLEMDLDRILGRIYRRLTAQAEETANYIFPVFDCLNNQNNSCNMAGRVNDCRLLDSEGIKPAYNSQVNIRYRHCDVCRGHQEFIPATWFTTRHIERMRDRKAIKMLNAQSTHLGFDQIMGSNFRLKAYPAFSANLGRVRGDIMNTIDTGFIPDLIVIDYADILAPEDARVTGRDRIDETWKCLKRMSDELHCCVATASQSNRASIDKKNVVQTDAAEDIRKIANSDMFIAINQTPQEKKSSITRISKIAKRDGAFDQYENVICLQQLSLGQVCLDSYADHPTVISENPYEDYLF